MSVNRDTSLSERLKKLYKHRCQLCDEYLKKPNGTIAVGAHIKALGRPHNGPDHLSNILCLCPNHHALFDAFSFFVDARTFEIKSSPGLAGKTLTVSKSTQSIQISLSTINRCTSKRAGFNPAGTVGGLDEDNWQTTRRILGGVVVAGLFQLVISLPFANQIDFQGSVLFHVTLGLWGILIFFSLLAKRPGCAWRLQFIFAALLCFALPVVVILFTGASMIDVEGTPKLVGTFLAKA